MSDREKRLSSYINSLNEERRPREHVNETESYEIEELMKTVRIVRSLKDPTMPEEGYEKKLAHNIYRELSQEKNSKKSKRKWLYALAPAVAAAALIIALNTTSPINRTNIVYAMEQTFNEIKAYHGFLEVVETNGERETFTQSRVEVWADKEGRYYVKGIEGSQKDFITVNDGKTKWQIQPNEKEVELFTAFPDSYRFTFELGGEIDNVKNALNTKILGEDKVAGRDAVIMEVTPHGGTAYKIWVDKETKMPLQKQSAMEYGLQYTVRYADMDFEEGVPDELLAYNVPTGYREINANQKQVLNSMEEAKKMVSFRPRTIKNIPEQFTQDNISVVDEDDILEIKYASKDNKKVVILQKKAEGEFKLYSMAVLGKINNNAAEIQSPVQSELGVLQGGGAYAGVTDITSVRWQEEGMEYAVLGNVSLEELTQFIEELTDGPVELSLREEVTTDEPEVKVPVDLEIEKADQKNADAGHSPWKLDPVFVAQVFVSLEISPEGIVGEYPIAYEKFKVVKNTGVEAVVEVGGDETPIRRVYIERVVRQDNTGVWTVVGYDLI